MSQQAPSVVGDIYGTVFRGGTAIFLARVVGEDGRPLRPQEVQTVRYSVYELDPHDPDLRQPVAGHVDRQLTPDDVLFDHLRRDFPWDVDETGYNFRHTLGVTVQPAFPHARRHYLVEYSLQPTGGQPILVRFRLWSL